ncbi:MAG: IS1595 family transposase [Candidatus Saccharimonas aalborgensis]
MRYTIAQFREDFPDDRACLLAVLGNRYGRTCPRCGSIGVKWYPITGRQGFVCSDCDSHVYPLAQTIFRKSSTSLWNWFYAIYLFSVSKNGVSAKELERQLGVTYKTAWRMCKQIRLLMQNDSEGYMLEDEVEVDETYIGGRHRKSYRYSKKQAVFGAVERKGKIKVKHVKSTGARVLLPEIYQGVLPGTMIYSDEWRAYSKLNYYGYGHRTVNHSRWEWSRDTAYTNTIEGFWGHLKRSLRGTYGHVSGKYLQLYLGEFAYRYNRRSQNEPIFLDLFQRAAMLS